MRFQKLKFFFSCEPKNSTLKRGKKHNENPTKRKHNEKIMIDSTFAAEKQTFPNINLNKTMLSSFGYTKKSLIIVYVFFYSFIHDQFWKWKRSCFTRRLKIRIRDGKKSVKIKQEKQIIQNTNAINWLHKKNHRC